jgi:hypothetical protein
MRPVIKTNAMYLATLTSVLLSPLAANAQGLERPALRQGYYLGATLQGVVHTSRNDQLKLDESAMGAGVSLRVGEMFTSHWGFGLRLDIGSAQSERWASQFAGLVLEGQCRPWRALAVHAGIGVGFAGAQDKDELVREDPGTGGAYYVASVSYDLFPFHSEGSGGLALTPTISVTHVPGEDYRATMVGVGLEVTWWTGLSKQALELPNDRAFAAAD